MKILIEKLCIFPITSYLPLSFKNKTTMKQILIFLLFCFGTALCAQNNAPTPMIDAQMKAKFDNNRVTSIIRVVQNNTSASQATLDEIRAFAVERIQSVDYSDRTGPTSPRAFRQDVLAMLESTLSAADFASLQARRD